MALLMLALASVSPAQDLEPRRWSHLPIGTNYGGAGYAYTDGDIAFDPVMRIEDGTVGMHTAAFKYIHSFELGDKSARVDVMQAVQDGRWSGLVDGLQTVVDRSGLTDAGLRFAVNLYGAPPLSGREFADYRAEHADGETIVGAGLMVVLPTGEYFEDKLINLGGNRFVVRPQLGMTHNRGPWTVELTGAAWLFADNDEFWNGNRLEQAPLWSLESHLIHTFSPGLWVGASAGFDTGGRSTINDTAKNDYRNQVSWALTLGVPISRQAGLKFSYLGSLSLEETGADLNTLAVAVSVLW